MGLGLSKRGESLAGGFGETVSGRVLIDPLDDQVGNLKVVLVLHDHMTVAMDARLDRMQHPRVAFRGVDTGNKGFTVLEERQPVGAYR